MFDGTDNDKPGVDEQYQTAGNTSDLTVEADRRGAGDVMIAAGWSPSRVGMALLRLHSEWGSAAKPRKPTKAVVDACAETIRAEDAQDKANREKANGELARLQDLQAKEPNFDRAVEIMHLRRLYQSGALPLPEVKRGNLQERAHQRAAQWYASELRLLAQGLKSREVVWQQVGLWIAQKEIDPDIAAEALLYWLDPTCRTCDGHGLRKVQDQPALSARQCHKCSGTGHVPHPQGTGKLLAWMDDCVQKARQSLGKRLHNR